MTNHPDSALFVAHAAIQASDEAFSIAATTHDTDAAGDAVSIADEAFARTPAMTLAGLLLKLEQFAADGFNSPLLGEMIMLDARRLLAAG